MFDYAGFQVLGQAGSRMSHVLPHMGAITILHRAAGR